MYLVFDIGGTFIKHAVMDSAGTIISKAKRPTPKKSLNDLLTCLFSVIEPLKKQIKGIAVSCPGMVDTKKGMIYYGGLVPFLHEVNLAETLESKFGISAAVENDGKCAALAELWLGSVKHAGNAVVLVLGSGVGGGIIIGGELYRGSHLLAGEVSYIMNQFHSHHQKAVFLGQTCSAVSMIQRIAAKKGIAKEDSDGEQVFADILAGDQEALAIFETYCLELAAQIYNLQYIIDPSVVAIGGGISAQPALIEKLNWALQEIAAQNPMHTIIPKIVPCRFQNDANLYGALYHFFTLHDKTNQSY
ncbi:ROK family protein [Bacillus atrophaeus]|uniref:ROK family protein n=1 Tax=Bacillus atrophaeus TaxID=1452 RepID=UPI0007C56D1C|nr:ROK family protein [Bacillus atrophaeus]WFE14121.1 ROK family protein [Bacillus atrophaeus]